MSNTSYYLYLDSIQSRELCAFLAQIQNSLLIEPLPYLVQMKMGFFSTMTKVKKNDILVLKERMSLEMMARLLIEHELMDYPLYEAYCNSGNPHKFYFEYAGELRQTFHQFVEAGGYPSISYKNLNHLVKEGLVQIYPHYPQIEKDLPYELNVIFETFQISPHGGTNVDSQYHQVTYITFNENSFIPEQTFFDKICCNKPTHWIFSCSQDTQGIFELSQLCSNYLDDFPQIYFCFQVSPFSASIVVESHKFVLDVFDYASSTFLGTNSELILS